MKTSSSNPSAPSKIWGLLTSAERRSAVVLLGLMFIGMVLETLGVGLVIPAIVLLMQDDIAARYPAAASVLERLGNPSQQALIVGGMLLLVAVYLIKALFLAFLAWRQTRFTFGVQAPPAAAWMKPVRSRVATRWRPGAVEHAHATGAIRRNMPGAFTCTTAWTARH